MGPGRTLTDASRQQRRRRRPCRSSTGWVPYWGAAASAASARGPPMSGGAGGSRRAEKDGAGNELRPRLLLTHGWPPNACPGTASPCQQPPAPTLCRDGPGLLGASTTETNTREATRAREAQNRAKDALVGRDRGASAPPLPLYDLPSDSSFWPKWEGIKAWVFSTTGRAFPLHGTAGPSLGPPPLPSSSTRGIFQHTNL